ncbi:MAG: imelysin family protein [Oligoflexus sp.]|jgi:predicted lipoprotein|nr:imelysin family protein [Pseudopedobacter sp.]
MRLLSVSSSKYIIVGLILIATVFACSKSEVNLTETNKNETDRKALLTNLSDNIIVPAYADFKTQFDNMLAKSDAFTATPNTANLIAFRASWRVAYINWQKVEMFDFGPGQTYAIRAHFNIYPTNVSTIANNIAAGNTNLEVPASYAAQGFPAIDYLINGIGNSDAEIVAEYTSATDATKKINYLKRITNQMNTVFNQVYTAWKGDFATTFKSKTAIDAGSSTSTLINGYILNFERYIRSGKIGIPAGSMTPGTNFPQKVEAFYTKDLALTLAKTAQTATYNFFLGKSYQNQTAGYSIKNYLDALNVKDATSGKLLSEIVTQQFDVIDVQLNGLQNNLYSEVINNNQKMINTYTEMQKLVRLLKVDMTSAMSITISYTDNDGD